MTPPLSCRVFRSVCIGAVTGSFLLASGITARAQDVMFVPPDWIEGANAPEQLPTPKAQVSAVFPEEMRNTDQPGYVVVEMLLDKSGVVRARDYHGSLDAYKSVAVRADEQMTWEAGRRSGKPVITATTYAYVFNPASAGTAQADATPRLLQVGVGELPLEDRPSKGKARPTVKIEATVTVGLDGSITTVEGVAKPYAHAVAVTAKNWRFAPARQKGEPVVAKIPVVFLLVPPGWESPLASLDVPPKAIKQVPPVYPLAMRMSRMRGEVLIGFIVDIEGGVRRVGVLRSNNPYFDEAAIEAVRQWRFEPGKVNGRVVSTRMKVPIVFAIQDESGGGEGPFMTKKKGDLSKLPEAFRYDTPPVPQNYLPSVYPYDLLSEGKKGRAVVAYMVNEKGVVVQTTVKEASSPEFGAALIAAVEAFSFKPALKNGLPCKALLAHEDVFEADGLAQLVGTEGRELLRREKKKPQTIRGASDLDEKLKPSFTKPPNFPLNAKSATGEAMVEFLVDETGRARLPRIVRATEEAFGYAAVQAVSTWRFEPPKVGGKSAVVRARVPFNFNADKSRSQ